MFKAIKVLAASLMLLGVSQLALAEGAHMSMSIKQGSFEDVKDDVEMAITGRGFVINNVSHVGEMLARTGQDLGNARKIFVKAEALEFCSANLSRKMMATDPDNIVFCPYIISIYVLPEKPNEVRVAYRKLQVVGSPAAQKSLREVNALLAEIIKEAVK